MSIEAVGGEIWVAEGGTVSFRGFSPPEWDRERVVFAHGDRCRSNGTTFPRDAFAWLSLRPS